MNKTKKIAFLGVGIALYVVLGLVMNIPLLAGTHLQTDLGYIAYSVFLILFGWVGVVVGIIGCFIESVITSGWIPYGWIVGQAFIGIVCGITYKKTDKKWIHILVTVISVFIGIAVIKTGIECVLFNIPLVVKFPKNFVAFVADSIPMIAGLPLGYKFRKMIKRER